MARATRQSRMISKRAEEAPIKYAEYSDTLGGQATNGLIKSIADDIVSYGTSDSNDVFLIEAAGYYLGKQGVTLGQIYELLKSYYATAYPIPEADKRTISPILGSLSETLENEEDGLFGLFQTANAIGLQEFNATKQKEQPAPPTKPGTPQASRASCLEAAAEKLKGAGYLAKTFQYNSAKPWSEEFDKGFRDYIEAASGGKALLATNPKLGWADVAASFGLSADLAGACSAITSDTLTAPIKTAPETSAGITNPASGETATTVGATKEDILPKILSYMQNTKIAETVGLNLIAEPRRASILIEAAGGVDNAAKVLRAKTEGLSEALQPVELTESITPEWVRRNKPVLQQIVGAINALVSSAVRSVGKLSLLPADRAKAVEKMKSFISQAHQNIQWTKIASKRKDRIRSEVATEMTVEDRITARRIKAKESV